jgi:ATP-binding cassette subfamily F protein uup
VVTQTIASEGDGHWKEYVGGYSDWLRQRSVPETNAAPAKVGAGGTAPAKEKVADVRGNKLSFKEKRELEQLPERIAALEAEQVLLQGKLADPAFYQGQPDSIKLTQQRLAELDGEIEAALMRWEELESGHNSRRWRRLARVRLQLCDVLITFMVPDPGRCIQLDYSGDCRSCSAT